MADCHKCKYSRSIPGDAHLKCEHPIGEAPDFGIPIMLKLISGQANGFKVTGMTEGELSINPHGIKNGWASWPLNFDPIWIDKCTLIKYKRGMCCDISSQRLQRRVYKEE